MSRFLCLLVACVVAAGGCSKPDDAKPNPGLRVPDVPKGRVGTGVPKQPRR